jgi:predicted MPP superfamily phosphohydrolase
VLEAALAVGGVGLSLVAAHATLWAPYRPVFRRYRVQVPHFWPKLSILHISDLHVRRGDPRLHRVQRAALAGLTPDLLCVTGDLCETIADVDLAIDVIRAVEPRIGTFAVLGNHEHGAHAPAGLRQRESHAWRGILGRALARVAPRETSGGSYEAYAVGEALTAAGVSVLVNAGKRLVLGGGDLWVTGSDSAWSGHADTAAAVHGRAATDGCLALVHEPELAFGAAAAGADLILAGHTHGGQVRFPVIGAPYTHAVDSRVRIASGFQRAGDALLHITAGLGHTIPLRWGCPPELVWLDCFPNRGLSQVMVATQGFAA